MIGYYYDAYVILNKIYSEGAYLKQAVLKTPIEEKNRKITVKIVYGVLDKDIERFLKYPCILWNIWTNRLIR